MTKSTSFAVLRFALKPIKKTGSELLNLSSNGRKGRRQALSFLLITLNEKMMHSTKSALIQLLLCTVAGCFFIACNGKEPMRQQAEPDKAEWMKTIPDTTPVCKISIPGSHDSGTVKGGSGLITQTVDVAAQLEKGIRAFDIRLQKQDDKLGIFHWIAFQDIYWETDVLPAFLRFLQTHPSETLIVSLKKEGGALEDYAGLLSASLSTPDFQSFFVKDFNPGLTLQECRGKILFLHRDRAMDNYPGAACSGWSDNSTCLMTLRGANGTEGTVLLQDEYQYESDREADKKIKACLRNFTRIAAEPSSSRRWGISFVSATGLPEGTPIAFANRINGPIADRLAEEGAFNRGVVFIDFIDGEGGRKLVDYIIKCNL